ncbi:MULTISPECIES: bacteriocin immunity protein [Photorhabdus]|uniref:Bacteriocin immunity protein n=1 Tax=Photorhabdus akhurstii TaxID=171438 RepID=A0ABX8LQI5_9GAMM|nr:MULTISPECIES: bacteriocin immunity protein [Photorhabdus]MBS9423618.1 bacteriocin immunity protein [Photorhabdus caribbeanensis]NHB61638.1 bacteriocin immunity protein [Photorhabdus sp. RW14-46]QXF32542.1 bacteriocin immunity protein [Photorhabdus akhurstii]UJD74337.1 bacteriocin immunity protein [Photorhabdus luminescens]
MENNVMNITENEFLSLIKKIFNGNFRTEEEESEAIDEFERISEHPSGGDLIFYPEDGIEDSPEGVLEVIKEWRTKNGKPGFKK